MFIYCYTHFWVSAPFCMPGWFCFAKKNEVHQWPESCLGSPAKNRMSFRQELGLDTFSHFQNKTLSPFIPGWCGMTSPVYSALPQELLLEADPRRPAIKTQRHLWTNSRTSYRRQKQASTGSVRCRMGKKKNQRCHLFLPFTEMSTI